jgi:hypothetical protein
MAIDRLIHALSVVRLTGGVRMAYGAVAATIPTFKERNCSDWMIGIAGNPLDPQ